ncbi:unnamed protein product [Hermetia illucens]|uniref:Raw n=1 Tax=Hermetia illucens TaxID=343691 RepID=A0A7R8YUX3_HERIL|nr:unnamed protein product [Hermetia illucens]
MGSLCFEYTEEALNAWRAKARCNVVPADRLQELFHELQFNPSEKQISEMLQSAKAFARKGSRLNGLTFGEFCVLAADLKRFRSCNFSSSSETKKLSSLISRPTLTATASISNSRTTFSSTESSRNNSSSNSKLRNGANGVSGSTDFEASSRSDDDEVIEPQINLSSSSSSVEGASPPSTDVNAPEVFLGGSCNPTTWRADVAIPTLKDLGISFYNPQVSDWTPDLIELEHRAKEKARVLFFVMDSETRASAGAIEAAHIAGQNSRHLVLVLHPYKPDQSILNEPISQQEYLDLSRNQQILREIVTRRGLPVLNDIPSGLQRTREILSGIRDPPSNIPRVLKFVRGAFERVIATPTLLTDEITLPQCQQALSFLGYPNNIIATENLKTIITSLKEILEAEDQAQNSSTKTIQVSSSHQSSSRTKSSPLSSSVSSTSSTNNKNKNEIHVNFDEFCVLSAYLSVLQQEIYESGCISPIKGTNLPPPPIFLANMQEGIQSGTIDESLFISTTTTFTKQVFRASSCTSVPDDRHDLFRNRDSGTSSPQPVTGGITTQKQLRIPLRLNLLESEENGEESDSNDSVFSSGSSINSNFCDSFSGLEFRDVYLGGSCFLRTKWRQDYAVSYFNSKGITYHMPQLHESILPTQMEVIKESIKDLNGIKQSSSGESGVDVNTQSGDRDDDVDSRTSLYNPALLDSSRVLLFVITNETRSLAPMTLAAHCIGLMYNVVLCVQMLPEFCIIGNDRLTPAAIKDYNRGRSYLIDLAKRQGVPVFNDIKSALECTVEKKSPSNLFNSQINSNLSQLQAKLDDNGTTNYEQMQLSSRAGDRQ